MYAQRNTYPADVSRLLVATDATADPHRLVRLCCERAGPEPLTVSLLVGVDASLSSESWDLAEELLLVTGALLEAAGVELEEVLIASDGGRGVPQLVRSGGFDALVVCTVRGTTPPAVLPLVGRQARMHGLQVFQDGHPPLRADQTNWLRRALDPLRLWQRLWQQVD